MYHDETIRVYVGDQLVMLIADPGARMKLEEGVLNLNWSVILESARKNIPFDLDLYQFRK